MEHKNEIFDAEYERLDEINEDLKLIQRKGGLTFGTDAYLLSAFVKKNTSGSCADFGCGTGVISLDEIVPEGKGKMSASAYINGRKINVGDKLG